MPYWSRVVSHRGIDVLNRAAEKYRLGQSEPIFVGRKLTRNTVAKKRAGQENVDSDYLFANLSSSGRAVHAPHTIVTKWHIPISYKGDMTSKSDGTYNILWLEDWLRRVKDVPDCPYM